MKRQSGFTLIELVIVIIILGVLSATAIPKFLNLQDDARESVMEGLKASLETAVTFIYTKAAIAGVETDPDGVLTLDSGDLTLRYGYPRAVQSDLRDILDFTDEDDGDSENQDDWRLTGSTATNSVIFTLDADTTDVAESTIETDSSICKLTYTQSAYNYSTKTGDRPVITISDCTD